MDIEKLERLSRQFREAVERVPQHEFSDQTNLKVNQFPEACCNDASLLVGAFLADNDILGARRVHGAKMLGYCDEVYHIWLGFKDGLILDIAGDQTLFADYKNAPVLVCKESLFHNSFKSIVGEEGSGDFRNYKGFDHVTLRRFKQNYAKILEYLE